MEKERAQQILEARKFVKTTGRHELRVSNVTPFERELSNGRKQVAIVNLAAMNPDEANAAMNNFNMGNYQEATNSNMTISVRDIDYLPAKGEILECSVTEAPSKTYGKDILVVSAYKPQPLVKSTNFSFADMVALGTEGRVEVQTVEEEVPSFGDVKTETES